MLRQGTKQGPLLHRCTEAKAVSYFIVLKNEIRPFSAILHCSFLLCSSAHGASIDLIWHFSYGINPEYMGGHHSSEKNTKNCPETLKI